MRNESRKKMTPGSQSRHLLAENDHHNCFVEIPDVVENFDPKEMVVTVGAATSVARLLKLSREHGLVPSGVQPDEAGTFGGLFSDPRESPCDPCSGRFRDHVLGIEGFRGDGGALLSGGRVVKNVTGYDLVRLLGGALGALGLITRLHLRLERQMSCWHQVDWPMGNEAASWDTIDLIRRLPFEPYWLSLQPGEQRCELLLAGTMRSIEESLQFVESAIPSVASRISSRGIGYQELVQSHREKRATVGDGLRVRMPWKGWRHVAFSAPGRWRSIFPSSGFGILENVTAGVELSNFIKQVQELGGSVCAEDVVAENRFSIPFVHSSPSDELTRRLRSNWDPQRRLYWRGDKK